MWLVRLYPQILGIDLASFLDEKSIVNDCIQFGGFSEKKIWGRQAASFMDKKNTF